MQSQTWLQCNVTLGQFTGEYVVTAQDFQGSIFSLFTPEEHVECNSEPIEGQSVQGWLQVRVLDKKDSLVLVQLPRHPLENGPTVTVSLEKLDVRPTREPA